jgi:hypothetical protein
MDEFLSRVFADQWRVILTVSLTLLAMAEIGYRQGLRLHLSGDEARRSQIATIQGAVLGMLGLLLGFSFAMAVERYDTRRQLVLEEANSIGTTFLRASFLPDAHRIEVENLLRRYVDSRLAFYEAGNDEAKIAQAEQRAGEIQRALWTHAVVAGREAPSPLLATFVNSLNDTIDLDATRLAAFRNTVPGVVWILLMTVAACGCWAGGYGSGAGGRRVPFATAVLPLLIAVVITLIADIDRPRRGLIAISQQSMLDLQRSLQPTGR